MTDRDPNPRFYPLRSNDVHLTIGGDYVRANGSLHHPASGTLVTNVNIEHRLSTDAGHALLDVPGLAFGPNFQPEELTRLTEGVVALVNGTVTGQGRIDWNSGGKVTSTGDFSTANMDLAAPFGPVAGLSTTIHFTDLLNSRPRRTRSRPSQSINPGIMVENGSITYQLLPNNLVRIERGEWPFMGGTPHPSRNRPEFRKPERQAADLRASELRRQAVRRQPRLLGNRAHRHVRRRAADDLR